MPHLIPAIRRALRRLAVAGLLAPVMLPAQQTTGVLVGRVLAGDVAVPSATIILGSGRVILARQDGRFRAAAPPGRYEVRAQRVGYTTARDTVTIVAGQTSTVNFKIERAAAMLEAVTSVASRGQVRSAIDVPAPVVIVQGADLRATGRTETAQMIASVEPGATTSRSAVAEGSDLIHPISLRGLNPDQVLVLVNGKRRHTSALLNVNRTIGRGGTGVDLNAIPASMIDRVEILRDGAVAQYGSDAIAGVINVVLKQGVHGDATSTVGRYATTFNQDGDGGPVLGAPGSASDGRTIQAAIDKGVVFGERGFLHGAFELRDRGYTNRTGYHVPPSAYRVGDPQSHDAALFLNGGNLFANGLELYGDAGGSRRTMSAAGAYTNTITAHVSERVHAHHPSHDRRRIGHARPARPRRRLGLGSG
jgi:Outer membrane receptor for ferrienterochelin and colicins